MVNVTADIYPFPFQEEMTNAALCAKTFLKIFRTEVLVILLEETYVCQTFATNCKEKTK